MYTSSFCFKNLPTNSQGLFAIYVDDIAILAAHKNQRIKAAKFFQDNLDQLQQ